MGKIDSLQIGEPVYVIAKRDRGPVVGIHPPTIIVQLMTGRVEVGEDGFERR